VSALNEYMCRLEKHLRLRMNLITVIDRQTGAELFSCDIRKACMLTDETTHSDIDDLKHCPELRMVTLCDQDLKIS
jgi:hypothetical protein